MLIFLSRLNTFCVSYSSSLNWIYSRLHTSLVHMCCVRLLFYSTCSFKCSMKANRIELDVVGLYCFRDPMHLLLKGETERFCWDFISAAVFYVLSCCTSCSTLNFSVIVFLQPIKSFVFPTFCLIPPCQDIV